MDKDLDLAGLRCGRLTVIERVDAPANSAYDNAHWSCACDCGGKIVLSQTRLRYDYSAVKHCGCENNLSGTTYGALTVLRRAGVYGTRKGKLLECRCVCARVWELSVPELRRFKSSDCHCKRRELGVVSHKVADGRKRCSDCRELLTLDQFSHPKSGPSSRCKRCKKSYDLTRRYSIDLARYEEMLASQGGSCAICGGTPGKTPNITRGLAVDHNHATGALRGLLCTNCNVSIGKFRDSKRLLEKAITYLNRACTPGAGAPMAGYAIIGTKCAK